MSSFFKFFAQTSPDLKKYLMKELTLLDLKPTIKPNINEIEFRANVDKVLEVMYKLRTIEGLKVQIGNEILARGEKEFEKNLKKLPWHAYINPEIFKIINNQDIKCKSFRSNLYHESLICEILGKFLNQLDLKRSLKNIQKIGYHKEIKELPQKTLKIQQVLEESREKLKKKIEEEKNIIKSDEKSLFKANNEKSEIDQANQQKWPGIFVYIVKDRASILLILNNLSLHKQGFRKYISWGPIRESLIAGCFFEANLIEKSRSKKSLKLYDPFCGSGTILLEAFSMYLGLPVRVNEKTNCFDLQNVRVIKKDDQMKYLAGLKASIKSEWLEDSEILLLGCDINKNAVKSSLENFSNLLQEHKFDESHLENLPLANIIRENPSIYHHSFVGNRVHFFLTDFENISKLISMEGFSIITNPPYGYRSRSHINFNSLKSTYSRFKRFLRRHLEELDEVYILYPIDHKNSGSLIKTPGLVWNLVEKFENGGILIGLFNLNKEKTKLIQNKSSSEIVVVNERILAQQEKIEKKREIMLKKQDPAEKERRKQEIYKEEKKFREEAKKRTKNLKFPREVTKKKKKLRQILHQKHQEFIRKKKYFKLVEAKERKENEIKDIKRAKSHLSRQKKGKKVLESLINPNDLNSEEFSKKLQEQLNKSAANKMKQLKSTIEDKLKKNPGTKKW